MDKKIKEAIKILKEVNRKLYDDTDESYYGYEMLNTQIERLEKRLLEVDKKYDTKHKKMYA